MPRANLLYSPRNKILATSLLIEAFLYEEQTRRGCRSGTGMSSTTSPITARLSQVRDAVPGEHRLRRVSMDMRNLLRKMGKKSFNAGNAAAMFFLNATNPQTIKLARTAMMGVGLQGAAAGATKC